MTGLYLRHSSMSLKIWRLKQQIELWNFEMLWLAIWVKMMFHPWQVWRLPPPLHHQLNMTMI